MIAANITNIIEFAAGYALVVIFLPSLCFHTFVREKGWLYRICFYQTIGNVYLISIGYLLAYMKCFYRWSVLIFMVLIPLLLNLLVRRKSVAAFLRERRKNIKDIAAGVYGRRKLRRDLFMIGKDRVQNYYRENIKGNLLELALVFLVMVFVLYFFGMYKFTSAAYGHTDEETHLYWIQSLLDNNIFPVGMYPFGLHFLTGVISTVFGISAVRTYLNIAVFSTFMIFLSAYILLRSLIRSRFAALGAWAVFAVSDLFTTVTYFRFQFSFPMEFGLVALMLMLLGLISYVKEKENTSLWMFILSVFWCFQAHFYVAIIAGILCVCFGIVFCVRMLRDKMLFKVIAGGILALILSMLPYGCGYLLGYPFERSINWALSIMQGDYGMETLEQQYEEETEKASQNASGEEKDDEDEPEFDLSKVHSPEDAVRTVLEMLASKTVSSMFYAKIILALNAFALLYGLFGIIFAKEKWQYLIYVFLALAWAALFALHSCYLVGAPVLVEMYRAATFLAVFTVPLLAMPGQFCYDCLIRCGVQKKIADYLVLAAGCAVMGAICSHGAVKKGRYFEMTVTEADMRVCLDLIDNYKKETWTVMSTTNDLSAVSRDGYHYEILDLLDKLEKNKRKIFIPTKYIFVVTEKNVTQYYESKRKIDRSNVIDFTVPVSPELARQDLDIPEEGSKGRDRLYYFQRQIVMSKLYYWMEQMKVVFPNEISVYYEDDCVTVYKIQQDEYFLLNLAVDYTKSIPVEEEDGNGS